MFHPRKLSIPQFGPRSNISPKLKMAQCSRVRRIRKGMSRFVSPRMKKIVEEIKKGPNMMRTIGAANKVSLVQRGEQNMPKAGHSVQLVDVKTSERPPLATGTNKSDHSPSTSQHMDKNLNTKFGNHPKYHGDKEATSSAMYKSNGTLRPLELSHKINMKQGLVQNSNCSRRPYSQGSHLKSMPGLIHNTKIGPTLDQGATKGMLHKERVQDECEKDKNKKHEPLSGPNVHGDIDCNMPKKRRIHRETSDVDDDSHQQNGEDDSTRLHPYQASLKGCNAEVSTSFVSKCIVQQDNCCSKPVNEFAWSGVLKVDSRDYVLAGHLSTKSCEKVWNLSKSLRRIVDATKVQRSEVWPKRWETSRPTCENIGLYIFPYKMRRDKSHDQLVKEVMENDLALRVTFDEAEMLIFSSSLLPEQYHTFQSKHYLWGVFRPRSFKGKHGDERQRADNNAETYTDANASIPIRTTVFAPSFGALPSEALKLPTESHIESNNQDQINSNMGAFSGRVVSFVVRQTPRVEQLIQEMEREGALIAAMQGEIITGDGSLSRRHA